MKFQIVSPGRDSGKTWKTWKTTVLAEFDTAQQVIDAMQPGARFHFYPDKNDLYIDGSYYCNLVDFHWRVEEFK